VCRDSKDGESVVKFTLVAQEHNKGRDGKKDPQTGECDKLRTPFKLQLQVPSNNQVSLRYKLAVEPTVEGSHYKTPAEETEGGTRVKNADEVVFEEGWTEIGPNTNACEVPNLQMDEGAAVLMSQWDDTVDSVAMLQRYRQPQQHPEEVEAAKHRFRQLLMEACNALWTPATWWPKEFPPGASEFLPKGLPDCFSTGK